MGVPFCNSSKGPKDLLEWYADKRGFPSLLLMRRYLKPHTPVSTLEMEQLIAHAQPADHARLSGHFTALADQYTAEAKRHTSMAQSATGSPSRSLATGMSAHCKQLAALDTQAAAAVRELAAYHQKLAEGTPSVSPLVGTNLEYMADTPGPTLEQLNALAARASTPADHVALEAYFLELAQRAAWVPIDRTYTGNP